MCTKPHVLVPTTWRQNIAGAAYVTSDAAKGRLDKTLKWLGAEMALIQVNGLTSSDRRQKIKSFHGGYFLNGKYRKWLFV